MEKAKIKKYRNSWNGINPMTKVMPTLVEKQRKQENKHKKKWNGSKEDHSTFDLKRYG